MFSSPVPVLLLALVGLSSCSTARPSIMSHGPAPVPDTRVNWPRPERVVQSQPGPYAPVGRDGIYSPHHYKHADKAARAYRLAGSDGIRVSYPPPGLAQRATYKTPVPGSRPVGSIVVDHQPATGLAGGNYKTPRPMVPTGLTRVAPASDSTPVWLPATRSRLPASLTLATPALTNPVHYHEP